MSNFIPNSFQVPNALIDDVMANLGDNALRCYLAIVRKTRGWNKESDLISLAQLMTLTGKSKNSVLKGITELEEKGFITREILNGKFGVVTEYKLNDNGFKNLGGSKSEPVQNLGYPSSKSEPRVVQNLNRGGSKFGTGVVQNLNPQNTNNKNNIKTTPLTPQGAVAGIFDVIFKLYTTAPTGCVAGRASDYNRAKREFEKSQDVNASELVEIIKSFWQHDDAWRRGYQPSLARFLAEKQYRNKPQAPRQQAQTPQRATAYLTPEQEIAKEQERKEIEKQRNLKIVADFEQGRNLSGDEFKGLYETNRRKSHEYLMALCGVDFNRYQELVGALKS